VSGPANWGSPSDRPQLDLSQISRQMAESTFRRMQPGEVAALVTRLKAATAQASAQQAWIQTATEVLSVLLKVALV